MRVAVVGAGIAGMSVAHRLQSHDLVVYEAGEYVGGHTNTVRVTERDRELDIDTGFIVYNERTYPGFSALLEELGVATQPSEMSFSVTDATRTLEYSGNSLDTMYAQRRNLLRPGFHRMVADILRFNRISRRFVAAGDDTLSLGDYLAQHRFGRLFIDAYIVPMGAAIWSMPPAAMLEFPALYFLRFFANHGLLQIADRPLWRTIAGGSARYVEKLTAGYAQRIRLREPVRAVVRRNAGLEVVTRNGASRFDAVFLACHSDEALRVLERPNTNERDVFGAIAYQPNEAVLHTDTSLLPGRRKAWAAWNYRLPAPGSANRATLTYNMNVLQRLDCARTYCVTLNEPDAIDPTTVLGRFNYAHPVYTRAGLAARRRYADINGRGGVYYCGAYWGYGFHEDGYRSAQRACEQFERDLENGKLRLRRVG